MEPTEPQAAVCEVVNTLQVAILGTPSDPVDRTLIQLRAAEVVLRSSRLSFNHSFVVRQLLVVHLRRWIRQAMPEDYSSFDPALDNLAASGTLTLPNAFAAVLQALEATPSDTCGDPIPVRQPDARVAAALSMIRASSREGVRLTVSDVASAVNLSRWHLEHLIKRKTGMRFTELIRQARVNCGVDLLLRSSLSVKEIAAHLGYQHPSQFNRDFRRTTGISPTKWRINRRPHVSITLSRI